MYETSSHQFFSGDNVTVMVVFGIIACTIAAIIILISMLDRGKNDRITIAQIEADAKVKVAQLQGEADIKVAEFDAMATTRRAELESGAIETAQ